MAKAIDSINTAADLYLAGDFARAAERLRRVAPAANDARAAARAWYLLGRSELALDRLERARRSLDLAYASADKALPGTIEYAELKDLRAQVLSALADVSLRQGRAAQSLEHLRCLQTEGLAGRTDAGRLAYRMAAAFESLGRYEQARSAYLRAVRFAGDRQLAREAQRRAQRLAQAVYVATAGTFSARSSAESVARALKERGLSAHVEAAGLEGAFAVALGRYDTREDAGRAARRAAACGFPATIRAQRLVEDEAHP